MENNKTDKLNSKAARAIIYILKVTTLFLILFFTFIEFTELIIFYAFFPYIYIPLYLGITILLAELPRSMVSGKGFFKRHILPPILLLVGVAAMFLVYFAGFKGAALFKRFEIDRTISNADEIIEYCQNEIHLDGIYDTEFKKNVILIDYDTMTVSFLFDGSFSEFYKFRLQLGNASERKNIQFEAALSEPGMKLITYYPEESLTHRTCSIELFMSDNTRYYVDGLRETDKDFLDLSCESISPETHPDRYLSLHE